MGRKAIDEKGHRYGRLLVLGRAEKRYQHGRGTAYWWCQCDCSNETVVAGTHLRNGTIRSCGCIHSLRKGKAAFNALIYAMKAGARKRNLEWNLTKEQVRHLTKQSCHYCGAEPSNVHEQLGCNEPYVYNGLDRADNTKGYTIDNVVPCCFNCNRSKGTRTVSEFILWVVKLYEHSANHQ